MKRHFICITTISLAVCLAASTCRAQYSSKTRSISGVGSGVTVGRASSTRSFNAYSAGSASYGNLYQAPQGGGALSSSIANVNQRSSGGGGSNPASAFGGSSKGIIGSSTKNISTGALASPNLTTPSYTPGSSGRTPVLAGPGVSQTAVEKTSSALLASDAADMSTLSMSAADSGQAYAAVFAPAQSSKEKNEEAITSLAPKGGRSGQYRRLMREGEDAFKNQDYNKAAQAFGIAYEISSGSSESLLSLLHVHFATAQNGYNLPSHYLQRILKEIPELPLISVHPRDFYGNPALFVEDVIQLEDYAKSKPKDANAQFVLAYIKWREKQPNQAATALKRTLDNCTNNDDLYDAIHTFWKGMVHSGAVTGKLEDVTIINETKLSPVDTLTPLDPTLPPQ